MLKTTPHGNVPGTVLSHGGRATTKTNLTRTAGVLPRRGKNSFRDA